MESKEIACRRSPAREGGKMKAGLPDFIWSLMCVVMAYETHPNRRSLFALGICAGMAFVMGLRKIEQALQPSAAKEE